MKDLLRKYDSAVLSYVSKKFLFSFFFHLTGIKFKIEAENKGWIYAVENYRTQKTFFLP